MRAFNKYCLLLVVLLLTLAPSPFSEAQKPKKAFKPVSAEEARRAISKKQQIGGSLSGVKNKMRSVQTKIHQAKKKENVLANNIAQIEGAIAQTKSRLNETHGRIQRVATDHDHIISRLTNTELRLKKRQELLKRRLLENYSRGQTTYLQVLLQARTMHELMARSHYVKHIVQSDTELIEGVRSDLKEIRADKRRLEERQRELNRLASEYEERKETYFAQQQERHSILVGVKAQRHEAEGLLDELEEEAEEMTSRIRYLSEILARRRESVQRALRERRLAQLRAQRLAQKQGRKVAPPPPEENPPEEMAVWKGGFIRPVSGPITSGFGSRMHPILRRRKMHTGVDFGVRHGTPIRAAGGGVVILASYSGGYGNCIIIDHGNNVTTLYGHCSALLVSEGQSVKQGQTIGRVGSTGRSTGPHLHWELRRNGVPTNPL